MVMIPSNGNGEKCIHKLVTDKEFCVAIGHGSVVEKWFGIEKFRWMKVQKAQFEDIN